MRRQMRYDVAVVIDTEWLQDNSGSIDYLEWIDYLRPEKASVFPLFAASYVNIHGEEFIPALDLGEQEKFLNMMKRLQGTLCRSFTFTGRTNQLDVASACRRGRKAQGPTHGGCRTDVFSTGH